MVSTVGGRSVLENFDRAIGEQITYNLCRDTGAQSVTAVKQNP